MFADLHYWPIVTASGITLAGIGSAFWGLLAGVAALLLLRASRPQRRALRGDAASPPDQDRSN